MNGNELHRRLACDLHRQIERMELAFLIQDTPVTAAETVAEDGLFPILLFQANTLFRHAFGSAWTMTLSKDPSALLDFRAVLEPDCDADAPPPTPVLSHFLRLGLAQLAQLALPGKTIALDGPYAAMSAAICSGLIGFQIEPPAAGASPNSPCLPR